MARTKRQIEEHDVEAPEPDADEPDEVRPDEETHLPEVDASDPRRAAVLAHPRVRKCSRAILFRRGVPMQDLDDAFCEVLGLAATARGLPFESLDDTVRYVGGIARHVGIRIGKALAEEREFTTPLVEERATASAADAQPEHRALLAMIAAWLGEKFPNAAAMYLERRVYDRTIAELSEKYGKAEPTVRKELSIMDRAVRAAFGAGPTFIVLLALTGLWRLLGSTTPGQPRPSEERLSRVETSEPTTLSAAALRDNARRLFAEGDYPGCAEALSLAGTVDPAGDTPELQALKVRALELANAKAPR